MSRRRAIALGALLVMLLSGGYLVAVFQAVRDAPMPISYWVVNDRTLGVQVIDGPASTCRVESTQETTTEIRVRVECHRPFLSAGSSAVGKLFDFVVALRSPRAQRAVLDGSGVPARLCASAQC